MWGLSRHHGAWGDFETVVDPCLVSGCNGLEHPKNIRISIPGTNAQVDCPRIGLWILLIKIGARGIRKDVGKE